MTHFYSHIIEIESVLVKLDEMELTPEQKHDLAGLIDSTIHHTVLDLIFSKLPEEEKGFFIQKLKENPGDRGIMEFLNGKVEGIEKEIIKAVNDLKEELHEDLKEAKKQ